MFTETKMHYRKDKDMKNIKTLLQDALDVCEDLHIEVRHIVSINWNSRLKAVWGRCKRTRYGYSIELNMILWDDQVSWEDALNTVIHEVLHCHEDRFCHTGEWKRCANLVNAEYPIYHISRCTSAEEKGVADAMRREAKYEVRCENCGCVSKYGRAGKVIIALQRNSKTYMCGKCKSTNLKLIVLK